MPRIRTLSIKRKRSQGQKRRFQNEKKKKIVRLINLDHDYFTLLKQGPSPPSFSSCSVAASYKEGEKSTYLHIEGSNDANCLEEILFDWTPESSSDPDEDDWISNFSEDHDNVARHEFPIIFKEEYERVTDDEIEVKPCLPEKQLITGHRIVDLQYVLNWSMKMAKKHASHCSFGHMKVVNERHIGLTSVLTFKCQYCGISEDHSTEDTQSENSPLNFGTVWDTLSTGNTYTHLKELLSVLNIPCLSDMVFQKTEVDSEDKFTNNLVSSAEEAGTEEKE